MSDYSRDLRDNRETITVDGANEVEFTVPAGEAWILDGVVGRLVSSAAAGNRTVALEIVDGDDEVVELEAGAVNQAASLTRFYNFGPGHPVDAGFTNTVMHRPLTLRRMEEGWILRVRDTTDVDGADDSLRVFATIRRVRTKNPAFPPLQPV